MDSKQPRIRLPAQQQNFGAPPPLVRGRHPEAMADLYHFILTRPWWQFLLLVAAFFLLINALFATAYYLQPGAIANARVDSWEDAFYFSVQTLATIGYGGMAPATRLAHVLVAVEALVGMLSVALMTGITFAKFARPTARVLFCEKAVLSVRDGVPHLMFRMANWRHNTIMEAQLRVFVLIRERTKEGDDMRRSVELKLVRDRTAIFFLTWTAMHKIEEDSPFYGPDAFERLRAQEAQIYLTLSGTDETFAQTIHARHMYFADDLVWGARFADVMTTLPDGRLQIDYARFHDVELPSPSSAKSPPIEAASAPAEAPPPAA